MEDNVQVFITQCNFGKDDSGRQGTMYPAVCIELGIRTSEQNRKVLGLLSLPLPGVVCSGPVALYPLNAALLLLLISLRTLARRQGGGGLRQFLAP